jgi:hypothetical protein
MPTVMTPKIVFLVMSAVHPVGVVKELARALAPHIVLVHHDFGQMPHFPVNEPNVVIVPDPKKTGWGVWAFTEGVFHGMRYAVDNLEFDYLQLLSPTCLPIKPLRVFEDHVASCATEADFSSIDLYTDQDALMSVGYRMFAAEHSLSYRILRRLSVEYFGENPPRLDKGGIQLRTRPARAKLPWRARIALKVTQAWANPAAGRHMFDKDFRPYFGSAWFGAHHHVVVWLLERFSQADIPQQFARVHIPEELAIPTLLKNSGFKGGPLNHCIITFIGANPKWIDDEDFEALRRSPAFFARKFPIEAASPVRQRVLRELVDVEQPALQTTGA